jgi:ADP-sugar diphosphatase
MFLRSYAKRLPYQRLFRAFTTMEYNISIADRSIPVQAANTDIDVKSVFEFQPFRDWCAAFDKELNQSNDITLNSIQIQNVDMFGSGKVGFVKFKADVSLTDTGKNVPGIVFMVCGFQRCITWYSVY